MHSIVSSGTVSNPGSQSARSSSVKSLQTSRNSRISTSSGISTSVFSFFVSLAVISTFTPISLAYPATMIVRYHPSLYSAVSSANDRENSEPTFTMNKRAFDRLDMSPFDFESLSKRYSDDGDDYYRRKKAFDRVDENGFFGLVRRRRAFDRLEDNAFMFGRKRRSQDYSPSESQYDGAVDQIQEPVQLSKRPFDRLETSAFGIAKKSTQPKQRLSIAQLVEQYPEYFPTQQRQSDAAKHNQN
ncbi:hypothetical protein Ddc_09278 [Ditylenchus destructor]|nr:hypothetical protein Ddc_09278 [Ditylenchus destructor]